MVFVRYSSVSLSLTLGRNEKVEQHIRKKTHKLNALRFWVGGGVILLYGWLLSHSCEISPVSPLGVSQQVVSESLVYSLGEYSLTLYKSHIGCERPYKWGSWVMYSGLRILPLEGDCYVFKCESKSHIE